MATKINPFIEHEGKNENPFVFLDGRDQNDTGVLIITREETQYVRGNSLFVPYKGIKIIADIDDAISINTYNDEIHIFRRDELIPPDQKEYLILLVYNDDGLDDSYQGILGRQEAFDYIVKNAEIIDMNKSMILSESTKMKDMWTVLKFTKMCINNQIVKNETGFDPKEYDLVIEDEEG